MRKLTIGLAALFAAIILMAGVVAAHGVAGAADERTQTNEQQEECEAMIGEMDDCPMADGGMMGMMHGDGMKEWREIMGDDMMEKCQEIMDDGGMMGMVNGGMMDGRMGSMMGGDGLGMGCH